MNSQIYVEVPSILGDIGPFEEIKNLKESVEWPCDY